MILSTHLKACAQSVVPGKAVDVVAPSISVKSAGSTALPDRRRSHLHLSVLSAGL
jgi:hypothetical protein